MQLLNPITGTMFASSCSKFSQFSKCKGVKMKKLLQDFIADETGATAIEYGLIAAGIAIAIITAVKGVGSKLSSNFATISTSLK